VFSLVLQVFEVFFAVGFLFKERCKEERHVRHRRSCHLDVEDISGEFSEKVADVIGDFGLFYDGSSEDEFS